MYARVTDFNITEEYIQSGFGSGRGNIQEALWVFFKRPTLIRIEEDGKIAFKYVDEDALSHIIGGRNLFLESFIIDLESMDMMENEKTIPQIRPFT